MHGKRSFANREAIRKSEHAGCYYCLNIFDSAEICEWVKDYGGDTAICHRCGIDAVVPYNRDLDKGMENFQKSLKIWKKLSF